jgi:hypothetical protein
VQYCSRACQKKHFASHKWDCLRIEGIEERASFLNAERLLLSLGMVKFEVAYKCSKTIEQGKYMYEQALDCYIKLYEKERNKRYTDDELYHAKSRIPFLLAALGHHGLAIAETELCAVHRGTGERTFSPSVYADVEKMGGMQLDTGIMLFDCWPIHYILPLLLVKMKLVADLSYPHQQFMAFKSTKAGKLLDQADSVIANFHMGCGLSALADQTAQMQRLFDLMELHPWIERPMERSFFEFQNPDDPNETNIETHILVFTDIEEDLGISVEHEEYFFVRDCFLQNPMTRANIEESKGPVARAWLTDLAETLKHFSNDPFDEHFEEIEAFMNRGAN